MSRSLLVGAFLLALGVMDLPADPPDPEGRSAASSQRKCPNCHGSGTTRFGVCAYCKGSGRP